MENFIYYISMILTMTPVMIYIIEIMTLWFCEKRKLFYLRFGISTILYVVLSYFIIYFNNSNTTYNYIILLKILLIFTISIVLQLIMFKISFKEAIFSLVVGYLFSNTHFYSSNIFLMLFNERNYLFYLSSLGLLICYLILYYFLVVRFLKTCHLKESINNYILIFSGLFLIIIHILSMTNNSLDTTKISSNIYGVIASLAFMLLLFDFLKRKEIQNEKIMIESILNVTEKKQKNMEETINIINIKSHDLRQQINVIKTQAMLNNKDIINELNNVEKTIDIYDNTINSSNSSLDIILMEKALIMKKNNIKYSLILNGELISFMEPIDIYTLFGNILDNSIDSLKNEEINKRSMSLNIFKKNNQIIIHEDNYCSKIVEFQNGLPKSNKQSVYHGIGTKSISFTVNKYKGKMIYNQIEEIFSLDIYFDNFC